MLKENMKNKIVLFKLSSGEEIVTKIIEEHDDHYVVKMPFLVQPVVNPAAGNASVSIAFIPCILGGDKQKNVILYKRNIVARAFPEKEMENEYTKHSSGIVVASNIPANN